MLWIGWIGIWQEGDEAKEKVTYQKLKKSLISLSSVLAAMFLTWTVVAVILSDLYVVRVESVGFEGYLGFVCWYEQMDVEGWLKLEMGEINL